MKGHQLAKRKPSSSIIQNLSVLLYAFCQICDWVFHKAVRKARTQDISRILVIR